MITWIRSRIIYRLLLWFLLLALVPLAVVTIIVFRLSQSAQEQKVTDNLVAIADNKALQLETYAIERQRDVTTLALIPNLIRAIGILEDAVRESGAGSARHTQATEPIQSLFSYYQQETGYENVMLFSEEGLLLFSLKAGYPVGENYPELPDANPHLLRAVDNAITLLETEISDFSQSGEGTPVAFIAAPVFDQGAVIGVVVIEINQQDLYNVVTDRTSLGQTGETVVALSEGDEIIITAPLFHDPEAAFQRTIPIGSEEGVAIQRAVQGIRGEGVVLDYRGEEVVAVWRYLPSLRWGMVVKIDTSEAYASLNDQRLLLLGLTGVTLVLVALAALTVSNNLSQPIVRLTETVNTFRQGNLETRAAINRKDEIGLLADGFNDLAQQIANQVNILEAQVADRTRDLQRGNLQLSAIAAVSKEVSNLREPQDLLPLITHAIQSRFGFYHVGIHSVDERGEVVGLVLKAAAGASEQELLAENKLVTLDESSLIGWVGSHRQARLAQDIHPDSPYKPHPLLPQTQAELVLPLLSDQVLLGVLDIQANQSGELTEESVPNFQTMADQITTALVNARLYQQTQHYALEMSEARQAAEEANLAKSSFLSNMSHELRTPLNAVIGFSQVMQRDPALTPTQLEHLDIIMRSGEHLLGLINDVLEMSKIEAGQAVLKESAFDLLLLLKSIEDIFRIRAESKNLQWLCDYDPHFLPHYISCDEGKLRQIMINLLGNAFKFTEEGGVTLRVNYLPDTHHLMMEIEDSGAGISSEDIKKLFQPFTQTASGVKSQEGTGLGLAISRQFVQLMGGEIHVKSIAGTGTIFTFHVTVYEAAATDIKYEQKRRVKSIKGDKTYRMLVVDDKADNRRLLREWLTSVGFEVEEAENGQAAIQQWERWEPHMIWMDMRMPVMDGYEATRRIKTTIKGMATVIIAFTASAFEHEQAIVLSAGCDDFVRKPARESEIFDRIAQHLGVEFIYDELHPNQVVEEKLDETALLELFAQVPAQIRAALLEAAENIDVDETNRQIQQLQEPRLVKALHELVDNYRFDTLQEWLGKVNA